MSETPAFKDAPLGESLLGLIDALNNLLTQINSNFTAQAAVVGAIGAPTFPTASAIASAAATAQAALAKTKASLQEMP
jgi:hypothetical protein